MENFTLSGVSVSDAAVAQLAKCVSSGASYPMQDLRRTFRQHLTGPGQRYFTGIQEIILGILVKFNSLEKVKLTELGWSSFLAEMSADIDDRRDFGCYDNITNSQHSFQ